MQSKPFIAAIVIAAPLVLGGVASRAQSYAPAPRALTPSAHPCLAPPQGQGPTSAECKRECERNPQAVQCPRPAPATVPAAAPNWGAAPGTAPAGAPATLPAPQGSVPSASSVAVPGMVPPSAISGAAAPSPAAAGAAPSAAPIPSALGAQVPAGGAAQPPSGAPVTRAPALPAAPDKSVASAPAATIPQFDRTAFDVQYGRVYSENPVKKVITLSATSSTVSKATELAFAITRDADAPGFAITEIRVLGGLVPKDAARPKDARDAMAAPPAMQPSTSATQRPSSGPVNAGSAVARAPMRDPLSPGQPSTVARPAVEMTREVLSRVSAPPWTLRFNDAVDLEIDVVYAPKWGPNATPGMKGAVLAGTIRSIDGGQTGGPAQINLYAVLEGSARGDFLHGWVDLHTHPMAHLGFAGLLMVGAPDVGSPVLVPKMIGTLCTRVLRPAQNIAEALPNSNPVHGGIGPFNNPCGDLFRNQVIKGLQESKGRVISDEAVGWDSFTHYPAYDATTHQAMYVDWIRRAVEHGGLRVIVALAVNNKTLAEAVRGPGDYLPTTDKESADLQIDALKAFAGRHPDLMEVAYTPTDLRRIVKSGRLAVVLGIEVDAIGNFHRLGVADAPAVRSEIDRLWNKGVRYMFPLHVIDNAFGGAALYEEQFSLSNMREFGRYPVVECAGPEQLVGRPYQPSVDAIRWLAGALKLGTLFGPPPASPPCDPGVGHVNARGMTELGQQALIHAMQKGMLIDVDHMSDGTLECALRTAEAVPGKYPLISGHNDVRKGRSDDGENRRTPSQLKRIKETGGVFGLGTDALIPDQFIRHYREAVGLMGEGRVAIGSDANGLVKLPRPPATAPGVYPFHQIYTALPRPSTGKKTWHYGSDGVAHYGMFADFLKAVEASGASDVTQSLMSSAEYFALAWEKAFAVRSAVEKAYFLPCPPLAKGKWPADTQRPLSHR
jgi:microsomal dipeptidase-like Zn-dependent dipeptidase